MKTNKMMRLASVLLVAVLLSTCAISGTFAKYTTTKTGEDSARVAKFGVTITGFSKLFSDAYDEDYDAAWAKPESDNALTVVADTEGTKVVAPGTSGTMAGFGVTGTPEVDVQVSYVATLALTNWNVGTEYCPIIFTVGTKTFGIRDYIGTEPVDVECTNVADLISKVEDEIESKGQRYHTNQDLSQVNDDVQVSWSWPFSTNAANDVKDTALGDNAADATAARITLTVECTITQIN